MHCGNVLRLAPGLRRFVLGQQFRDPKQAVGYSLHRGNDDAHARTKRRLPHKSRRMEHSFRSEQRASSKFEGHDGFPQRVVGWDRRKGQHPLETASPFRRAWVTLHAETGFRPFRAHGSGSLFTAGATLEGAETKKPTARIASGGGLETFSSWLAVSPRARSDCS